MPCNAVKQFEMDLCQANLGGIKAIWLANYVEGAAQVSTESGATEGVITGFTSGVTWTRYPMRKNAASMTSTLNTSTDGAVYVSTELVMNFSRMEAPKRLAIQALALGECMALVEDSNGTIYFLGKDEPVTCTAGSGQTGQQKTDANQYSITLTDESMEYPFTVAATLRPSEDEDGGGE